MNIRILGIIPTWWRTDYAPDVPRAYDVFRAFLSSLRLSLTDLANDIGVSQSTVSRWAVGRSDPTPQQMEALIAALRSRIERIGAAAERASRTTEGLDGVVKAFEAYLKPRAGAAALPRLRQAAQTLHAAVKESEVARPPTRRRVR